MCRTRDASTHTHAHSFQFFSRTAFVRSVNKPTLSPAPQNYGDSLDASWRGNRPNFPVHQLHVYNKEKKKKKWLSVSDVFCFCLLHHNSCTVTMHHITCTHESHQLPGPHSTAALPLVFFFFNFLSPITKDERKKKNSQLITQNKKRKTSRLFISQAHPRIIWLPDRPLLACLDVI